MKKYLIWAWGLLIAFVFASCTNSPGDVLEKVKSLHNKGDYESVKKYYTKGTVEAMEELKKLAPDTEEEGGKIEKKFAKGTKWKIVSEKIDENTANVKIQYIDHPIENMKGSEITFKMRKEDGEWKVDMEKEMRIGVEMLKELGKMGKDMDIFRKMQKYVK